MMMNNKNHFPVIAILKETFMVISIEVAFSMRDLGKLLFISNLKNTAFITSFSRRKTNFPL